MNNIELENIKSQIIKELPNHVFIIYNGSTMFVDIFEVKHKEIVSKVISECLQGYDYCLNFIENKCLFDISNIESNQITLQIEDFNAEML